MEQLTPQQRIEAYRHALAHVHDDCYPWVCVHLFSGCHNQGFYPITNILGYFPEFLKHKPEILPYPDSNMWWPEDANGNISRIAALEQCIKECLLLINQPTGQ